MPGPNTNDFEVFDKVVTNSQYLFYETAILSTAAVERPLTASRGCNVERYVQLRSTDRVFHVNTTEFAGYTFNPAVVDSSGEVTEVRDHFWYDGIEFIVLFAELENFGQSALVVGRQM